LPQRAAHERGPWLKAQPRTAGDAPRMAALGRSRRPGPQHTGVIAMASGSLSLVGTVSPVGGRGGCGVVAQSRRLNGAAAGSVCRWRGTSPPAQQHEDPTTGLHRSQGTPEPPGSSAGFAAGPSGRRGRTACGSPHDVRGDALVGQGPRPLEGVAALGDDAGSGWRGPGREPLGWRL